MPMLFDIMAPSITSFQEGCIFSQADIQFIVSALTATQYKSNFQLLATCVLFCVELNDHSYVTEIISSQLCQFQKCVLPPAYVFHTVNKVTNSAFALFHEKCPETQSLKNKIYVTKSYIPHIWPKSLVKLCRWPQNKSNKSRSLHWAHKLSGQLYQIHQTMQKNQ